jgi:CRISPR-associated protein Cmr3
MNTLLLHPTDVLFFRDGRPMGGSLSGHGAAWPLPTVTNAALHAALWRTGEALRGVHEHRNVKRGRHNDHARDRKFGALVTAGPFPVKDGCWLFPRPLDAGIQKTGDGGEQEAFEATFLPLDSAPEDAPGATRELSSLPTPLTYPVANRYGPTKVSPSAWWNADAWQTYLGTAPKDGRPRTFKDRDFSETEYGFGIGMDAARGTQDGKRIYSAQYLRLREKCGMGLLAAARDKKFRGPAGNDDLIAALFPNPGDETPVVVGGQQRICTVRRQQLSRLPLPTGRSGDFSTAEIATLEGRRQVHLLKWILLAPAIFPFMAADKSYRDPQRDRRHHGGGWLPSWICPDTGRVLLQGVDREERARRRKLNSSGCGYDSNPDIAARLVAALVGKAIPVTGYALAHEATGEGGGAKPLHWAVPAGSVYYFVCESKPAAHALAAALNWHGLNAFETIRNRRSALFGEKGFGIGVCGTWKFHDGTILG